MMSLVALLSLAWLSKLTSSSTISHRQNLVATTLNGSYHGIHNPVYNQDMFFGIRYAQSPVGDLRFSPPQSLNSTWSGTRDATKPGYSCIGYGGASLIGSTNGEDCLNVDIVRPSGSKSPLPVVVWIYGGGFVEGSASAGWYNTSFLVERSQKLDQPILAVSINYRMAAWGWLWSDQVVEQGLTNVGLRDQRLALHWVQENIAAFGGDPSRVTIMGESAGALSVNRHILAYNGRDDSLFHGAICQSGSLLGVGAWDGTTDKLALATANITETLCPDTQDKLSCLRQADLEPLNNAIAATLSLPVSGGIYGPVIDGDIIARDTLSQLLDGSYVSVPMILGSNNDETSGYYTPLGINSDEELHSALTGPALGLSFHQATVYMEQYRQTDAELSAPEVTNAQLNETVGLQFKRATTILTDATFKTSTYYTAEIVKGHNKSQIFIYNANTTISVGPNYAGSSHGFELAYMFNNVDGVGWDGDTLYFNAGNPFSNRPEPYLQLASEMSGMWVGFINTAIPHFDTQLSPIWPAYEGEDPQIMIFDAQPTHLNVRVGKQERIEKMKFMIPYLYGDHV